MLAWAALFGESFIVKKRTDLMGIRLFFIGLIVTAERFYVLKLQKDNAILKANAIKLESAISEQKTLIENQKKDFEAILNANKEMNELIGKLKTDFVELDKRFNKKNRDVGLLAIEKTEAIERITNSASDKANRCIEIRKWFTINGERD